MIVLFGYLNRLICYRLTLALYCIVYIILFIYSDFFYFWDSVFCFYYCQFRCILHSIVDRILGNAILVITKQRSHHSQSIIKFHNNSIPPHIFHKIGSIFAIKPKIFTNVSIFIQSKDINEIINQKKQTTDFQMSEISEKGQPDDPIELGSSNEHMSNSNVQEVMLGVNGDVDSKAAIWVPRVVVIALGIMIFLLGFAVPRTFMRISNQQVFQNSTNPDCNPTKIDANSKIACNTFDSSNPKIGLVAANLIVNNQFILYDIIIEISKINASAFTINQQVEIQLFEVEQRFVRGGSYELYAYNNIYNETMNFKITSLKNQLRKERSDNPDIAKYEYGFAFNRIEQPSSPNFDSFLITMRFTDFSQISSASRLSIQAITITTQYTNFTIIIRGVYFLLSLISAVIFIRRFCQLTPDNRVLEIKMIASGSIFLVLFNDPFYAITILKVNPVSTFFSSFVVVNMLVFIISFWAFVLLRIFYDTKLKNSDRLNLKKSWPLYVFLVILNIAISVMFNIYSYHILKRIPIITITEFEDMKVLGAIIVVGILLLGIVNFEIFMYFRIVYKICKKESRFVPLLGRHARFLGFTPFFILVFAVFFIVGAAMPYSLQGIWVLYGYSFMNLYIFVMQYMYYTPASELAKQSNQEFNLNSKQSQNDNPGVAKRDGDAYQIQSDYKSDGPGH